MSHCIQWKQLSIELQYKRRVIAIRTGQSTKGIFHLQIFKHLPYRAKYRELYTKYYIIFVFRYQCQHLWLSFTLFWNILVREYVRNDTKPLIFLLGRRQLRTRRESLCASDLVLGTWEAAIVQACSLGYLTIDLEKVLVDVIQFIMLNEYIMRERWSQPLYLSAPGDGA